MLRAALWTLRQRRYRAVAALMAVVAVICAGAGTFELHRYRDKVLDNTRLRANAHASSTTLTTSLVPLVGARTAPDEYAIRYRTVRASGTYDRAGEQYVDDQSQGGRQGFNVLTPLRTTAGTLLVVRGFVAARADESRPADVPAPPAGRVTVVGRLQIAGTADDHQGLLGRGEITAINPAHQAQRLGAPVYQVALALAAGRPGTRGLRAVPGPDLSNPTGGAGEAQLLSYIVQWYVFALLALAAPFLFARSEIRDARRRFLGVDADTEQFDARPVGALEAATSGGTSGALVRRGSAELVRPGGVTDAQWRRATRLADRYGRSLGPGTEAATPEEPAADVPPHIPVRRRRAFAEREIAVPSSTDEAHRSDDAYHGSYNDYLWQLAMADGDLPEVTLPPDVAAQREPTSHSDE